MIFWALSYRIERNWRRFGKPQISTLLDLLLEKFSLSVIYSFGYVHWPSGSCDLSSFDFLLNWRRIVFMLFGNPWVIDDSQQTFDKLSERITSQGSSPVRVHIHNGNCLAFSRNEYWLGF